MGRISQVEGGQGHTISFEWNPIVHQVFSLDFSPEKGHQDRQKEISFEGKQR
jgi:hypothetical protein